eukprot:TRINITY_DN15077_c0_g4_i2.p1 TRINITY_DN15077_c0_g4~~TRINITY_DN15077_c0_g4_i2.p1  ORF type:complete len:350 (+),score=65.78 TRINITY_DN15077_c0_g4_i2:71-1120(+)
MESVVIAACDLDKTLYPPEGPNQYSQLVANVESMFKFEAAGGFVFPVTGNNLLMAQKKLMNPAKPAEMLRELRVNPGIYTNGGLVLGPDGRVIEKHALGNLVCEANSGLHGLDFVTGLLNFFDDSRHAAITHGVGLLLLAPEYIGGYDRAYDNVDEFASLMQVTARKISRDDIVKAKQDALLVLLLFPPLKSKEAQAAKQEYADVTLPKQKQMQQAMQEYGLMDCCYSGEIANGVGNGIKLTLMKDPWPEIDINVAGVDKGKALSRFITSPEVLQYLGRSHIDPQKHVAVFGDAPNDLPMFEQIGGVQPAMRVAMPHADDDNLIAHSNVRAEVADVLMDIVKSKKQSPG